MPSSLSTATASRLRSRFTSAASSLSRIPGWCQITVLRSRSTSSSISVPRNCSGMVKSLRWSAAPKNARSGGRPKCRESSIRLTTNPLPNSLFAGILPYASPGNMNDLVFRVSKGVSEMIPARLKHVITSLVSAKVPPFAPASAPAQVLTNCRISKSDGSACSGCSVRYGRSYFGISRPRIRIPTGYRNLGRG